MKKMKKEERCKNEEREEEKRSRSRAEDGEWKKTREIKKMFRFSGFLPMEIAPDEGQSRRKKKAAAPLQLAPPGNACSPPTLATEE